MRLSALFASVLILLSACSGLPGPKEAVDPPADADVRATEDDLSASDADVLRHGAEVHQAAEETELERLHEPRAQPAPEAPAVDPIPSPVPPADVWERLRRGFALQGYDHARVTPHLEWYSSHSDYLDRVARRAEPFLHLIAEEVERRGMPGEIALLPVVESAFRPFAYSHGRAAGMWQFIPGTGKRFGLKQNWWYDGRRDVLASTHAALDYLEYLHERFDGDWLLALAAYNSGEGTVGRAVARNRAKGMPTSFWYLRLPRETESYAPKLLALAAIVSAPEKYDIALHPIADEPRLATVEVGSQIDLAMAADLAGMDIEDLYQLNPGFNRWATDPDGPHRLLVPLDAQERFEQALAQLPADQRMRWERYRIQRGDSLIAIAKRYRTTPQMLRSVNKLRGNTIVAGRHLLIPVASRSFERYALSAEQRQKALHSNGSGRKVQHTVRGGDTLWALSRRYTVPVRKLAAWNGMAPGDVLKPGRTLVIWGTDANPASPVAAVSHTGPAAALQPVSYVVRRGDSLARIARRFRVSIQQLCEWNGISRNSYLQPGQRLKLHVDVTQQSS